MEMGIIIKSLKDLFKNVIKIRKKYKFISIKYYYILVLLLVHYYFGGKPPKIRSSAGGGLCPEKNIVHSCKRYLINIVPYINDICLRDVYRIQLTILCDSLKAFYAFYTT